MIFTPNTASLAKMRASSPSSPLVVYEPYCSSMSSIVVKSCMSVGCIRYCVLRSLLSRGNGLQLGGGLLSVCGVEFSVLSVRWSVVGGLFVSVLCVNEYIVGLMGGVVVDTEEERSVGCCTPVSSGVIGLKLCQSRRSRLSQCFGRSTSGVVCCESCCSVTTVLLFCQC